MTTWNDLLKPGNANDFFTREFPPFEPDATAYSRANAMWLAELCRLVYRDDGRQQFLDRVNLKEVKPFNQEGTQAFLVEGPSFAALVFRGSDDLQAWFTNLKVRPDPLRNGVTVHTGFEEALDVVWEEVTKSLGKVEKPCFFSGHSLGAALATIAASRIAPRALYTFGSPLVGNREFVDKLRIPIYRVDDGHDIVTTVPPAELGYVHAGQVQLLHVKKGTLDHQSWFEPPEFLADHAPINYVERI
jgi:hypothetical protein